jgi:hypothetical protein
MCLDGWIVFLALFWFVLLPGGLCALALYIVARFLVNRSRARQPSDPESIT